MPTRVTLASASAVKTCTRIGRVFPVNDVLRDGWSRLRQNALEAFRFKLPSQLSAVLAFVSVHYAVALFAYPRISSASWLPSDGKPPRSSGGLILSATLTAHAQKYERLVPFGADFLL
jgi:hypothetical protein